MTMTLSVLPLALLIALGYALAKSGVIPRGGWDAIETLCFRALIPAVLVLAIARSDLSSADFSGFITALLATFVFVGGLVFALRFAAPGWLENRQMTSVFQLGIRWNAFVALAAMEQFAGDAGFAVMAVGIALLIPLINITCILVLAAFGPQSATAGQILRNVMRNPLVQACAIGLVLNFTGVSLPGPIEQTIDMVGRGALAIGLMAIGGAISLRRLTKVSGPLLLAVALRPVLAPLVFLALGTAMGLPHLQIITGVLIFAAPAASNGYIIAKQMGGDAELYADALTWQVVLCICLLPVWGWALL
ncbi:MAG: AEC family transporter [Sulfitobacter sp.]